MNILSKLISKFSKPKEVTQEDIIKRIGNELERNGFTEVEINALGSNRSYYTYKGSTVKKGILAFPMDGILSNTQKHKQTLDYARGVAKLASKPPKKP